MFKPRRQRKHCSAAAVASAVLREDGVRVSVVLATLDQAATLPHVFARLPAGLHEVIVVDGNSSDDTVRVARLLRPDVHVVLHTGHGEADALACGAAHARGDLVVAIDLDGSVDPAEIPSIVDTLLDGAHIGTGAGYTAFWIDPTAPRPAPASAGGPCTTLHGR